MLGGHITTFLDSPNTLQDLFYFFSFLRTYIYLTLWIVISKLGRNYKFHYWILLYQLEKPLIELTKIIIN